MAAAGYSIPRRSPGWLYGPATDVLLGAGLAYVLSVPLVALCAASFGIAEWPLEATLLLGLALSTPHYGATLLRVYGSAEDRRRYALFAWWISAGLLVWFVAGLHGALVGSALVTLYFAWSPWHFAGQNYGLALMFLRRRGLEVAPRPKRCLYAAFAASWLLTLLVFQSGRPAPAFAPDFSTGDVEYDALRLGIPGSLTQVLAPLLVLAYAGLLAAAAVGLRRAGAGIRDLALPGLLALTQSMWFMVPAWAAASGHRMQGLAFTAVWASVAHSVQYLWVTSYYARRADASIRLGPYYGRAVLAGCAIQAVPALVFAPHLLGTVPWTGGLAILVFSFVNLHHFALDGAVWKLRDGAVARLLLRSDAVAAPEAPVAASTGLGRGPRLLAWALGLASLGIALVEIWDARAARSDDLARLEGAARRLAWIGRERVAVLGRLGDLYDARGSRERAEGTWRHALSLRRDPAVLNNLAWQLSVHPDADPQRAAEAVALAEEAVAHYGPDDYVSLDTLAAAYAAAGRFADARRVGERALSLARADRAELAPRLESRLALYRAGRPYRAEPHGAERAGSPEEGS